MEEDGILAEDTQVTHVTLGDPITEDEGLTTHGGHITNALQTFAIAIIQKTSSNWC